jgi:hydrogenase maturation protease
MLLIGVQPAEIEEWGGALTPLVAARIAPALDAAVAQLTAWGAPPIRRATPPDAGGDLILPCLARAAYERADTAPEDTAA